MQQTRGPFPSRELGRKLKESPVENAHEHINNALELLKFKHKSLYAFVTARKEYFYVTFNKGDKEFFVTLKSNVQHMAEGVDNDEEEDEDEDGDFDKMASSSSSSAAAAAPKRSGSGGKQSYSEEKLQQMTVKALRELLREAGVSSSGTKAVLIERSVGLQTANNK